MAGYRVHTAAMEQVKFYMEHRLNIPIILGDRYRIMAADREKPHYYWNADKNEGVLFDLLEDFCLKINKMSKHYKKNVKEIDVPLMSWYLHSACHYIVDAHTIWLISLQASWSKSRLEQMGELTWQKKVLGVNIMGFPDFDSYRKSLTTSIRCINETYKQKSHDITFPFKWGFRQMIREIVKYGADYTLALVRLGWDII